METLSGHLGQWWAVAVWIILFGVFYLNTTTPTTHFHVSPPVEKREELWIVVQSIDLGGICIE